MSKNILFLVTGMTPQIITETVYALSADPENTDKWIPDEVHVLTTGKGMTQIRSRLLNDGWFNKLVQDYQLPAIKFDESTLHVITDESGQELEDLKTLVDNECSANQICQKIREFTQDSNNSVHVSIAGGRKTMGFYAGYALSLYGRAQDRMSHVLVSEDFEQAIEFYYPTNYEYYVEKYKSPERLDAREARVFLADIPFIRMKDAILPKHQLRQDDGFVDVVNKINESYKDVKLQLNVHSKSLIVNDRFEIKNMPSREFAMLYWFADLRKQGKKGIIAPKDNFNSPNIKDSSLCYINQLTKEFLHYYEDFRSSDDFEISVDKKFFESVRSLLKSLLQEHLGLELAAKILIKQNDRGTPFYLPVETDAIYIVNTFKELTI